MGEEGCYWNFKDLRRIGIFLRYIPNSICPFETAFISCSKLEHISGLGSADPDSWDSSREIFLNFAI